MYSRVAKRVRARDPISMNRSLVTIPYLGAWNPHCPEYPLIHEILLGIPSSGDSVQWGFRVVIILYICMYIIIIIYMYKLCILVDVSVLRTSQSRAYSKFI